MQKKEHIFISGGDLNGIGIEIVMKSLTENKELISNNFLTIITSYKHFENYLAKLKIELPKLNFVSKEDQKNKESYKTSIINFIDISEEILFDNDIVNNNEINFGKTEKTAGLIAAKCIKKGVLLAKHFNGAIVTAPINKESLHLAGYKFPGHTEYISEILGNENFLMILDGEVIKVALVTTHLPLKDISKNLSIDSIFIKGKTIYDTLVNDYGIKKPRIAVCALNPHASDGGIFGNEEAEIISPAVMKLKDDVNENAFFGPLPSDTLFTQSYLKKVDAYLVMYHDQGLIPLKLLSFGNGINFTAGLSIIRTSPDHGTAFDIAGKGIADNTSFSHALDKAMRFLENRIKNIES